MVLVNKRGRFRKGAFEAPKETKLAKHRIKQVAKQAKKGWIPIDQATKDIPGKSTHLNTNPKPKKGK